VELEIERGAKNRKLRRRGPRLAHGVISLIRSLSQRSGLIYVQADELDLSLGHSVGSLAVQSRLARLALSHGDHARLGIEIHDGSVR